MTIKILMPALSPTMTEGNLAKWIKKEGDVIEAGDIIAEIETDKATMEVEAVDEGVLGKIIVEEGTQAVPVNQVIAILLEDGEDESALDKVVISSEDVASSTSTENQEKAKEDSDSKKQVNVVAGSAPTNEGGRIFASPLAKRMAKEANIDISKIKGTGPKGRVVKADIEAAKKTGAVTSGSSIAMPVSSGPDAKQLADMLDMEYDAIPNSSVRKVIAQRLTESKLVNPHFYLTIELNIDKLLDVRKQINDAANGEFKISVNDFILKAVANSLRDYPAANVSWAGDAILQYKHSDVCVAVATENGLITPIVKEAENKSLKEISVEVKDLAKRAREGKLKPTEFQGGTFSVSNLGMYGISEFAAIINPPQACIMAVGAGIQKPVVKDDKIEIGTIMKVTISTDHRAVDGAVAAEFLQIFKNYIENPVSLLI